MPDTANDRPVLILAGEFPGVGARDVLAKWGNDLRQTGFDARLLMNHAIRGVNAGYISRHKLLEDHLRAQQQAISSILFSTLGDLIARDGAIRSWLGPRATRNAIQKRDTD